MAKDKSGSGMGSFKISDAVKKPVSPTSAAQLAGGRKKGAKEEPAPSVGFPNIEHLIEADTLDRSGLTARVEALTALSSSGSAKEKAAAKKALAAYARVNDLLDYLWSTKQQLGQAADGQDPGKKKGSGRSGGGKD
jgi:hypothetical protein